ncbi:MAG TPA: citramalate synthase, partial [Candidatus Bathyarchaeota archaeon]|nr:citramalate synthase [Candidatus Bathyarchaeota archaeon]
MRLFNEYFVMVDVEREVLIYDTTLRDGNQAVDVNLSVRDKLIFSRKLDEFGVAMIEGGWPNPTNPAEREYFEKAMKLGLRSEIAAFGMTRKAGLKAEEDSILNYLADTPCHIYTLFGKSWSLHVRKVLNTTLDENLEMISDTVSFLKKRGKSVVYDAEHFYDGFKDDE